MFARWVTGFVLVLSSLSAALPSHAAQIDWTSICPNQDGKYYESQTFPGFQQDTGRIVKVSRATREIVQVVDRGLQNVTFFGWSPDCHYLIATMPNADGQRADRDSIIWDMVQFRRVALFPHIFPINSYFDWDPTSNYVVLGAFNATEYHPTNGYGSYNGTGYASYLWNMQAHSQVKLTNDPCNMVGEYFDIPAGQLLAVRGIDSRGNCTDFYVGATSAQQVTVFSLQTGQVIRQYGDPNAVDGLLFFTVSPDGSKLVLYTNYTSTTLHGGYLAV